MQTEENHQNEDPEKRHLPLQTTEIWRSQEYQYLQLIDKVIQHGTIEHGRNGWTKSIFGHMMRFSLQEGTLPLITTKKLAWKACFHELMFFIRGKTCNDELNEKGVHIWDANSSREYLDSYGMGHYARNELGPIYGYQWRHWNKPYHTEGGEGIDQLQNIIRDLKDPEKRTSRRLILSAWNPEQLGQMVLPPCHIFAQFHVRDGKYLSCSMYQRSADIGLGVPFNIASYSFMTHILAHHCGLVADEFIHFIGNAHVYKQHIDALNKQCNRIPFDFPKIRICNKHENIEDYTLDDIVFQEPYRCHPPIVMNMVA